MELSVSQVCADRASIRWEGGYWGTQVEHREPLKCLIRGGGRMEEGEEEEEEGGKKDVIASISSSSVLV